MKQRKIRALLKEKIGHISLLAGHVGNSFDKKTIHDLRIGVKALRSFLRFLNTDPGNRDLKMAKKFKRLYHISGAVRDAQLESEMIIKKKLVLPAYTNKLGHLIKNQKNEWAKHYSAKTMTKLRSKLTGFKFSPMLPGMLEAFFVTKFMAIDELSQAKDPSDTQMHSIRKSVKDILYASELAAEKWKEGREQAALLPVKQLDIIAKLIGKYHDETVLLSHLNLFSSKAMLKDEEADIETFCAREARRLNARKKRILAAVKKMVAGTKKNYISK